MNIFTSRSQQPPNSWSMSLEREPSQSTVIGVTLLAPWPGEGAGLHTLGNGLEPWTQIALAPCPELPVSPASTESHEERKQMGPWTQVHRPATSSPAAGGPGHAWTEREGGGPGTRRPQVWVAASRGQEGGEVMGKAAIPAPRLSRLPIKADPKPGRVRMRGRLCCEVCNCSLRPLSQPPDQRPSGHSLSTGKGNKGTAAAAQLPHGDWALTSDLSLAQRGRPHSRSLCPGDERSSPGEYTVSCYGGVEGSVRLKILTLRRKDRAQGSQGDEGVRSTPGQHG